MSKKVLAPLGALDTKAKALEVGVQFAKDIGIQDFILESDSLVLYRAITRLVQPPSFVDSMVLGYKCYVENSGRFPSPMYTDRVIDRLTF